MREIAAALALEPAADRSGFSPAPSGSAASPGSPTNRFFLPETLARLAEIAGELADSSPDGTFTAAAFKDRSGIGRNLTIQMLEFLDKMGATRRLGDARIVLHGTAVFGPPPGVSGPVARAGFKADRSQN